MVGSGPCVYQGGYCTEFGTYSEFGPINKLSFRAPNSGKVIVTATGAMQCLNTETRVGNYGVIDLSARINTPDEPFSATGDGVTRFAMRMPPVTTSTPLGESVAVNLSNTRVFKINKGPVSFEYRFVKNRMDEGTYCYVHNLSLSGSSSPDSSPSARGAYSGSA
ncbi:hypothetical protein [Chenggangzhangella methanolivorans]|uniref:Uncharacterized protein n=1 Tax=Chenggangzhangella methanolivorans TaxID=1437009 RepID=A0A9E6UJZ4_9HYPH|nr:hypothetical protein [Chenggangzhangella methanolivorans]QZO02568.1 hypothetical protein K6K41_04555 [Chenggangzhangella methanolivorans]